MAGPRSALAVCALLAWLGLALATPSTAAAAGPDWKVTATPLHLEYGTPSTITVMINGGETALGSVELILTSKDAAGSAKIVVEPSQATWTATIVSGDQGDEVVLAGADDGDHLTLGETVKVDIEVTSAGHGAESWKVTGHRGTSTSSSSNGLGSQSINGIVVDTTKPTPQPTPTPRPTSRPTPEPTPNPTATSTPGGPGSPTLSPGESDGQGDQGAIGGVGPSTPAGGSGSGLTVGSGAQRPDGGSTSGDVPPVTVGNVTPGSSFRWLIPTFALSVPGLLIVGAVAIQLITGLTFMELTRRWLGSVLRRRRRGP